MKFACSPFAGEAVGRRWYLVGFLVMLSILISGSVFWLTTPPMMSLWEFLLAPWVSLFTALFTLTTPNLRPEEYIAVAMMAWWLVRMLYLTASARMEQWNTSQRINQVI